MLAACAAGFIVLLAILRIMSDRDRIQLHRDSERTRRSILAVIPLGTESGRARQIMEADGFRCESTTQLTPADVPGVGTSGIFCAKVRWAPMLVLGSHEWHVSIFVVNEEVRDVQVLYAITAT
jgi:hypothetical protein